MAIEFNCPYCTATIRVPDQFSGKRGSCPKCGTKLLVPDVAPQPTPQNVAPQIVTTPPPVSSAPPRAAAPGFSEDAITTPDINPAAVSGDHMADSIADSIPNSVPAMNSVPATPVPDFPSEIPVFTPPSSTTAVSQKLKRKTRQKRATGLYGLAVPAICFLLFFGIVSAVVYLRQPELKGTLTGSLVGDMDLQPARLSLHDLQLSDVSVADAATAFEGATETFISPQLACSIGIDGDNLSVTVRPGAGHLWFAVNPSANMVLADWIRNNRSEILEHRRATLATVGNELCKDKILKQSGTPVVFDAINYRDNFGLTAHVGAFGYVVQAMTDNRLSPCAHEDSNGTLYFALPENTTTFQLKGREINGETLFPGEYTVKLPDLPPPAPANAEPTDAMPDSDSPMSPGDESAPDEKPGDWDPSRPKAEPAMDAMAPSVT